VRFRLDQGLPRSSVRVLRAAGFESDHVGDLGLARASDASILREAEQRRAVVVTLDTDFHAILAVSGARAPSVIRIRIQGLGGEALARAVMDVVSAAQAGLEAGAADSVTPGKVRVRLVPIGG
jgi:predicted nuclease of predicted toxin-antitoxin system